MTFPHTTTAQLIYLRDLDVAPVSYYKAGQDLPDRVGNYERFKVEIGNGRDHPGAHQLEHSGFQLLRHESSVDSFYDDEQVSTHYYPEVTELLKRVTGAREIKVFDHTIRVARAASTHQLGLRAPVELVHNDYTHDSGPKRLQELLGSRLAAEWLQDRVWEVNIWRPIVVSALAMPLALCDARTVQASDFVRVDLVYPDRVGEIYHALVNEAHRWTYFPAMQPHEALIFKCYDSHAACQTRFTLHTAFEDPATPQDAPPRQSIETRAMLRFG